VVAENIVSSTVHTHLFDFSNGWLYVFGVGVLGAARFCASGRRRPRKAVRSLPQPHVASSTQSRPDGCQSQRQDQRLHIGEKRRGKKRRETAHTPSSSTERVREAKTAGKSGGTFCSQSMARESFSGSHISSWSDRHNSQLLLMDHRQDQGSWQQNPAPDDCGFARGMIRVLLGIGIRSPRFRRSTRRRTRTRTNCAMSDR